MFHPFKFTEKKSYFCEVCKKGFLTSSDLKRHESTAIHQKRVGKMETKGDNSDNSDQMDTDQSNDSESEDTLKCLICNQKYITNLDLKEHIKTVHTTEKEKTILKARYILKSKDFRSVEYDDPVEYTCENCSEVVRGKTNLIAHNFQYHHVNPEFEKNYPPNSKKVLLPKEKPCRVCLKTFPRNCDLTAHVLHVHCNDRRYLCKICGSRFNVSSHLQRHLIGHAGIN